MNLFLNHETKVQLNMLHCFKHLILKLK